MSVQVILDAGPDHETILDGDLASIEIPRLEAREVELHFRNDL
jgi:hypothetical protein